jgi:large conductance mechanosensitive channel
MALDIRRPLNVRPPGWVAEFKAFIMRGNVVDMAVGIIIGLAFAAVVNSLVKDIITPVIGLLVGGIDFTNIFFVLKGTPQPTLAAARAAGDVTLNLGVFINTVISFIIISFAIFWMVKLLTMLKIRQDAKPAGPTVTESLLTEIRDELRGAPKALPAE